MPEQFILERSRLVNLLWARGWWPQYTSGSEAVASLDLQTFNFAMLEYQALLGVPPSEDNAEVRFCLHPDRPPVRSGICKWGHSPITWHTEGGLNGVSAADFKATADMAYAKWAAVCGAVFKYIPNPKTANLWLHAANLGGSGGVLADQQLPCGASSTAQMEGRYDSEFWRLPGSSVGRIPLLTTIVHEMGHGIGIDHGPQGCIMAPTLNMMLQELQAWDIAEGRKRYGDPKPSAPVPPPSGKTHLITIEGRIISISGYRITEIQ